MYHGKCTINHQESRAIFAKQFAYVISVLNNIMDTR